MTVKLEKLIEELNRLSDEEQDAIATIIQEELAWKQTLKTSGDKLTSLADEALKEYRAGKIKKGDW